MKLSEFNQLKKLMQRTTSDSDPEALTALRMANKVLARNGLGWERVFERLVTVEPDIEVASDVEGPREPSERLLHGRWTPAELEAALSQVLIAAENGSGWRTFLLDLEAQWRAKSWLSLSQCEAIMKGLARMAGTR